MSQKYQTGSAIPVYIINNSGCSSTSFSIVDADGNPIGSHIDADGDYHLGVAMTQSVFADENNSSDENLVAANAYTFTGVATSTLGVIGLQWSLKTDQNATVYVEQSPDGTNWDISYPFDYIASKGGRGETVQATQSYWRLRVVLTGTDDTTYFRLQGVLCPVAMPMSSNLTEDGRVKVSTSLFDPVSDIRGKISPFGKIKTVEPVRTIGTSFGGTTKDTNFWTESVANGGSVAQAGEITLATSIAADGEAQYNSVRRARHVAGSANEFKFTGRLKTAPVAQNIRRCGVYDDDNGFFFEVDGVTFGVASRKGGVDTQVQSGSFNGDYGSSLAMSTTMGNFVIWWWERTAYFFVNGLLLHKIVATTESLVNTNTLPIRMETINTGSTIDNSFEILVASVFRLGDLATNPTYYHLSGNAATHVLKQGAGVLHKVMYNNVSGTSLTMYDGVDAGGDVIGIITTTANAIGEWEYYVPFNDGLTLVTVGNSLDATIIYE